MDARDIDEKMNNPLYKEFTLVVEGKNNALGAIIGTGVVFGGLSLGTALQTPMMKEVAIVASSVIVLTNVWNLMRNERKIQKVRKKIETLPAPVFEEIPYDYFYELEYEEPIPKQSENFDAYQSKLLELKSNLTKQSFCTHNLLAIGMGYGMTQVIDSVPATGLKLFLNMGMIVTVFSAGIILMSENQKMKLMKELMLLVPNYQKDEYLKILKPTASLKEKIIKK